MVNNSALKGFVQLANRKFFNVFNLQLAKSNHCANKNSPIAMPTTPIGGTPCDTAFLNLAESLIQGRGDGRLSKGDAKQLFQALTVETPIPQILVDTISFVLRNFRWTAGGLSTLKKTIFNY